MDHWREPKYYLQKIILVILLLLRLPYSKIVYSEKWETQREWNWQATVKKPEIFISDGFCHIKTKLDQTSIINQPILPFYYKIIYARPENISISINRTRLHRINLPKKLGYFKDHIIDGDSDLSNNWPKEMDVTYPTIYPENIVDAKLIGYQKGVPLTGIRIYPYQLMDEGQGLKYFSELLIRIRVNSNIPDESIAPESTILKKISNSPVFDKYRKISLKKKNFTSGLPTQRPLIKLALEQDGIYRVYKNNLVDSLDKLKAVIKSVDPRTFKIYNKGKKIPIYVHGEEDGKFDKGDYIEFIGMRNPNNLSDSYYHPFNNKNVYWLSWNGKNGLRYSIETAQPTIEHNKAIIPREYKYTEHIEENNSFVRLGRIATDAPAYKKDHWFFDGGIRTGTTRNYSFNLSNPNPYSTSFFSVQAQLHGLTYTGHGHNVTLYINNHLVARGEWEGQRPYTITSEPTTNLQNNFLNTGENNIQIAVEGSYSEDRFDEILFNWLEVEYYRQYRASDDFIEFTPPHDYPEGTYHFPIENFSDSDISVYKIGISKLTDFTIDHNQSRNKYSIILEDKIYSSDTRYFAASKEGIKSPLRIQADTLEGIRNNIPGCDLIIITPDKWTNNLIRLADFYKHNGIIPQLTCLADIYNEFNHGIASPFAIKQYLEYMYKNSTKQFDYVLLIGDAQIRADESILPAFFYQSYRWGACACDHIYTLIDKDSPLPQFAIGRWPCSSSEELEQLISKRINYQYSHDIKAPWHNETMFIAGFENTFKTQSDYLIKRNLSKNLNVNRIFINPAAQNTPYWGGSDSLIEHINSGLSVINFFGHGGGGVWSDRSLFTTEHLPLLENQKKLPFITSMTCFTGDFVNITGLGEDMIKISNGGAIGLFGSSSVGWIQNDYLLCKEIYSHIFQPGLRIGDAIRISKIKYLTSNNYFSYLKKSMAYSYNLLGDPTITLPITQKEIELETSINEPSPGQKIQLSGELPFNQGEGYIKLYDLEKYRIPIKPSFYDINNSDFQTEIILPDTISTEELYFNYYFRDGNYKNDYIGHTSFHIKGENFYSFKCSPEKPEVNEKINLKIKINHENLDRVLCLIDSMGVYKYLDENGIEHVQSFGNNVNIDTLEMIAVEEKNCHKLSRPLVSNQPGKLIAVKFVAFTNAGDKTESIVYTIQIKRQPDLRVIKLTQTENGFPALLATVYSNYEDTLADIELQIRDGQGKLFGSDHFKIYPDIRNELLIKGILGKGRKTFIAEIDPENEIIESNENNNLSDSTFIDVNTFPILPEYGSSYYGSSNDTIRYNRYFSVYIPPGAKQDSAAMQIYHNTSQPGLETQPDFEILSQDSIYSYSVNISPPEVSKDLYVEFYGIPDSIKNNVSITCWSEKFKLWTIPELIDHGQTRGYFKEGGKFAIAISRDNISPTIELSVDGKQFFSDSYISQQPNISIIGEDKNGIIFNEQNLQIYLDDEQYDFSKINLPDTIISGNSVTAQFRPMLEYGNHNIRVILQDAAGNTNEEEIGFIVSDKLKLKDYGNFPNPFKTRTTFIYELTKRVDDLKIKIYTVSGRHIKTIDNTNFFAGEDLRNSGYHEVTWDGLDKHGNFLANGVYFYKIYIKKDDKTKHSIGKIAKSR